MKLIASFLLAIPALAHALSSPDGQLQVDVSVNAQQQLVYSVQRAGQPVLLASQLGLVLEQGDYANGLKGGRFHASRLASDSTGGHLLADIDGPMTTPWRVLAIGPLKTVMESTLGTALAAPAIAFDKAQLKPGHASWSWPLLKDEATVYDVQKRFIAYAADMHWNYTLVDAEWDRQIGDAKMKALAPKGGFVARFR